MIFLYGPQGVGKTTLGKKLGQKLNYQFVDLNEYIQESKLNGKTISSVLYDGLDKETFKDIESEALTEILSVYRYTNTIVSLGSETLMVNKNRLDVEKSGYVFCLNDNEDQFSRAQEDGFQERLVHYMRFPNQITKVFSLEGSSLVLVGQGISKVFLERHQYITDSNIVKIYQNNISLILKVLEAGELNKTIDSVQSLWAAFKLCGISRNDIVASLGGGVVGDLVGFATATWMRGIDWINIPTTLLAMVDAGVGGKTGFDLEFGKNLVGAFHDPKLVIIDKDYLKTLSPEQIAEGRAEMIKHQVIAGLNNHTSIEDSLSVKIKIVQEDPFEKLNKRILLNCGHTIAHAIEKITDYKVSHGQAVAIGCVEEARLALKLGLTDTKFLTELEKTFQECSLLTSLDDIKVKFDDLIEFIKVDKKKSNRSVINFVLPCNWGDVRVVPIDLDTL